MIKFLGQSFGLNNEVEIGEAALLDINHHLYGIFSEGKIDKLGTIDKYVLSECQTLLEERDPVSIVKHVEAFHKLLIYEIDNNGGATRHIIHHHIKLKIWDTHNNVVPAYINQSVADNTYYDPKILLAKYFERVDFLKEFMGVACVKKYGVHVLLGTFFNFTPTPNQFFYICKYLYTNSRLVDDSHDLAIYDKLDINTVGKESHNRKMVEDGCERMFVVEVIEGQKVYIYHTAQLIN